MDTTHSSPASVPHELDVRPLPPRDKHATIFRLWAAQPVGAHFVLINDHDPVPLYYQFAGQYPDAFTWEYLEQGPEVFRVRITRTAATAGPVPMPPVPVRSPTITVTPQSFEGVVDARGLEPPEPMMRILTAVNEMHGGCTLLAYTDRRPVHLLDELSSRGLAHSSSEQPNGAWLTRIHRT